MRTRELEATQRRVVALAGALLVVVFQTAGLDRRYHLSAVPIGLVLAADATLLLGHVLFVLTIRANRYASRVVEVQANQPVISSGPYALVRHPMYLAVCLMIALTPISLGSYAALMPALLFPLVFAQRIRNEEDVLRRGLPGYDAYCRRVRYRLIPGLW